MASKSVRIVGSSYIAPQSQAAENVSVSSNQPHQIQQHSQQLNPSAMPQQLAPSSSAYAASSNEYLMHKNRLQEYTQRANMQFPRYQTVNKGTPNLPRFESTVWVNGVRYTSNRAFSQRRAAEQDVAKVALEAIYKGIQESEESNDRTSAFLTENAMSPKSILLEIAAKINVARPTYDTVHQAGLLPAYVSSVVFNGATYTGDIARNREEAEHLAAQAAITSLHVLQKDLGEKKESLESSEAMINALITKERKTNDELQEVRKELIDGLKDISRGIIGVKRMGELDPRPFVKAMSKRYNKEEAKERAVELCSLWNAYLMDPHWHPFKIITVDGIPQQIIRDEDEKLNSLKKHVGEGAYNAVVAALTEINEYNPSGCYETLELWNYGEERRATLKEGVEYLIKKCKSHKRKR